MYTAGLLDACCKSDALNPPVNSSVNSAAKSKKLNEEQPLVNDNIPSATNLDLLSVNMRGDPDSPEVGQNLPPRDSIAHTVPGG